MSAALLTGVAIGLLGQIATAVTGLRAAGSADIWRHVSFGIYSTLVTLLAHSMMMFYLIGKGKAVKDALAEQRHNAADSAPREYARRIATARRPVFSIGTLAMAATMITAIAGASVDTRTLPPIVHAFLAYGAIACNLAALRVEAAALAEASRVVDDVNRFLAS